MPARTQRTESQSSHELVTIGESMVAFIRQSFSTDQYRAVCIGAESNVAINFAQLGGRVKWSSALGDDELGRLISRHVCAAGVEASVRWDPSRPTGVAIKEVARNGRRLQYYRNGSAASNLLPSDVPDLRGVHVLHLSGITPALSDQSLSTVMWAIDEARRNNVRVSFDVNFREGLWPTLPVAREVLLPLCSVADVIFVGDDEAESLVGSLAPEKFIEIAELRESKEVVFKRGARRASVYAGGHEWSMAPPRVDVTDVTGAGDAFAAGYLRALCLEHGMRDRLRWAHWCAARVVQVEEDTAPMPNSTELQLLKGGGGYSRSV